MSSLFSCSQMTVFVWMILHMMANVRNFRAGMDIDGNSSSLPNRRMRDEKNAAMRMREENIWKLRANSAVSNCTNKRWVEIILLWIVFDQKWDVWSDLLCVMMCLTAKYELSICYWIDILAKYQIIYVLCWLVFINFFNVIRRFAQHILFLCSLSNFTLCCSM